MITIETKEVSEQIYTAKFMAIASEHGIPINYVIDRATLDLGLHLTVPIDTQKRGVTSRRVWFQFKSKNTDSLNSKKFNDSTQISQSVEIEHLRQWYRYSEAVYLVVYLESVDKFFAVDIHKIINELWGDSVFKDETFINAKNKLPATTTIHLPKTSEIDKTFWEKLHTHRSIRVDGATYQARPIAHQHDFQSRVPQIMKPELFQDIIGQLLVAHRFRLAGTGNNNPLVAEFNPTGDIASIAVGKFFDPFQYDHYLTRELIPDEDGYREDGQTLKIQGDCAVIVHSLVKTKPDVSALKELAKLLEDKGIKNVLSFVNHYMTDISKFDDKQPFNCFSEYNKGFSGTSIKCMPIHLEDIGKNLLLSTTVYINYREQITWLDEIANKKIKTGELRVLD